MNIDYFQKALIDEQAHLAFLGNALGSKAPSGLTLQIPPSAVKSGQAVLNFGVALETAFVETYLGAVETLSSADLKLVAAKVGANEATHFSFFDGRSRRPWRAAATAIDRDGSLRQRAPSLPTSRI